MRHEPGWHEINTPMTAKERERAFLIGAPLAIIPALCVLPAGVFLVIIPRVAHAQMIALLVLPVCAIMGSFGLWKLALGAVQKPWGIFNVLSFGALLVLLVIASYTGLFLALVAAKL
ncbi:MAG: hypothetical protein LAO22_10585 [Acidobacteriia bacterium]|nr:hypothetical protein [Terriglobia bacterium]